MDKKLIPESLSWKIVDKIFKLCYYPRQEGKMNVLCIILGILLGIPLYLLLNYFFVGLAKEIIKVCSWILPGEGIAYQDMGMKTVEKVLGWLVFVAALLALAIAILSRLIWIIYQIFRAWVKLVKKIWNFGGKKTKINKK